MNAASVVVARPSNASQLILLFHGVGSSAANLVPLGRHIANAIPNAIVVSVDGPHPSSMGGGREWFSVAGVTEENRPARVAQALPAFVAQVEQWQAETGLGPPQTSLVGFSQGAIMSLESTQANVLAQCVVAVAGRFAQPPRLAPQGVKFRFVHGDLDGVISPHFSQEAAERLRSLGSDGYAQIVPDLGHGIDARAAQGVVEALA
ncbi:esterase [Hydrogenophaga sp. YM1]|uniref:esterase n=1 Tax=Hydrogenophaga sp. YM1 TaxID=2806262 RepID=UPI00195AB576|nr:esterase [Hydrogenophaga sp. YM1]QRR32441.1 esterase [Hydrogenophaga sp. YM1]